MGNKADRIYESLVALMRKRRRGVSFVELMDAAGEDARGNCYIATAEYPNNIWWDSVSREFADAFWLLKTRGLIEIKAGSTIAYLADGAMLRLPLVKRACQYKKPHWLPLVFNLVDAGQKEQRQ